MYLVLGPSGTFWIEVASGGSYLARLGELGGNHLPHFCYKMAFEAEGKGFSTFDIQFSLKIRVEKKKERKNLNQDTFCNASMMFL